MKTQASVYFTYIKKKTISNSESSLMQNFSDLLSAFLDGTKSSVEIKRKEGEDIVWLHLNLQNSGKKVLLKKKSFAKCVLKYKGRNFLFFFWSGHI